VKKLPLFSLALVAAIPALWFIWIVVGGPMREGNYGTFQVQVFKNKAVLVMLLLTLIVCALLAFTPVLALIFGGGSESLEPALADGGGTAGEVDPETDEAVDDDPFEGDEDDEDDDPFAEDDEESDGELEIEGLDEDDIFDEDDEDDGFAFDDE
jgi:hypothetical protein